MKLPGDPYYPACMNFLPWEHEKEEEEPDMCPHCNGSGEGKSDYHKHCYFCKGKGVIVRDTSYDRYGDDPREPLED